MSTWLTQWLGDGEFVARLVLALILGGLIGLERQSHGRPAGLRTNILVCLGSAAIIVAFQKLFQDSSLNAESVIRMDPARAAAGVITGIGFLGAGTIVKSETFIRGLTTAASIWVVAAVGIILGLGQYDIALVLTALVLVTLMGLHHLRISSDRYARIELAGPGTAPPETLLDELAALDLSLRREGYAVDRDGGWRAVFSVRYRDPATPRRALARLAARDGVTRVSWE